MSHSAAVFLWVEVGERRVKLGQVGPNDMMVNDDVEIDPCVGALVVVIDGRIRASRVRFPDGIKPGLVKYEQA